MGYMKFNEFVEKQKNKQAKPKVAVVPDYDGPSPDAPSLGKTPENSGGKGQSGKVAPYKGGKNAPDPNKGHGHDGLGHKGKKENQYMPKTSHSHTVDQKELGAYPHIKTSEWIDETKNLSLAEFTKRIRSERLRGLDEGANKAYAAIRETVSVCARNNSYIPDVVLELKRSGLFEAVFAFMAQQPEAVAVFTELLETDSNFSRKVAGAISEMVAPSMSDMDHDDMHHDDDEDEDHEDDMDHDDMHHHDDEDEEEDEEGDEDDMHHDDEDRHHESSSNRPVMSRKMLMTHGDADVIRRTGQLPPRSERPFHHTADDAPNFAYLKSLGLSNNELADRWLKAKKEGIRLKK
jgi:hypothetical protein